jgi:hypothetical protein
MYQCRNLVSVELLRVRMYKSATNTFEQTHWCTANEQTTAIGMFSIVMAKFTQSDDLVMVTVTFSYE